MDLAQAFAAAEPVCFAGRTLPVRQLCLDDWAELMAFLKSNCRSPVTIAVIALQEARDLGCQVDQDVADVIMGQAQAQAQAWPPKVGTRAWLRALDSIHGGTATFLQTVFKLGGTELTRDECQRLSDKATQDEFDELVRLAYFGDPPAPKAETPDPNPATTPSPTTGRRSRTGSRKKAGPTRKSAG